MTNKNKKPYEELYDRVNKTAKSRFNAHIRLSNHNNVSLFTITLFSLALLVLPLGKAFGIKFYISDNVVELVQCLLTIVILAISIALSMASFAFRSEKFHYCGKELNNLLMRLYTKKDSEYDNEYESLCKEYHSILSGYENHKEIDYMRTKYYSKQLSFWKKIYLRYKYLREFIIYVLLIILVVGWIGFSMINI